MLNNLTNIKTLYFGSYDNDITEIFAGKFLTAFKSIACCFAIPINDIYGSENSSYISINFGYDIWNKSKEYLNKQEIPNKIKITNNAKDWIKTSGKSIGYLYSIKVDDYLLNHLKTFNDSDPKWEVIYTGRKKLSVNLIKKLILNWECEYSPIKSKQNGYAIPANTNYERPYTYAQIKDVYGIQIADKLYKDQVHRWRMNTGIELIHKEPDLEEQKRIWKNWQLMSDDQKKISDEKCMELTGMNNEQFNTFIMNNYWKNTQQPKLKRHFDILYENIMKNYLEQKKEYESNGKYNLFEINFPIVRQNKHYFLECCKHLLLEDYHIFPVPKLLLDNIEQFVKDNIKITINSHNFVEKTYLFKDILKLTENWDKYKEFQENIKLMLMENSQCKIVCCIFNSITDVENILSKYVNIDHDENTMLNIYNSFAYIYNYNDNNDFNCCLCINARGNMHKIRKVIQHELIHWQQVSLNSHTNKTYGLFNNKKFNLTNEQFNNISNILNKSCDEFKNDFEYVLNGREFEAWVANTCEEFEDSKLTIEQFKDIIENFDKFKNTINVVDNDKQEMFIFGEICYLSSLNDNKDNRYWYLIEALKENKDV